MRVFAFGCSMTSYLWPSWADVIGHALDVPYQNWGLAGMGNLGILCRLSECHLRHRIGGEDIVLIMWTSPAREDRFVDDHWQAHGNVYNQDYYGRAFLKYVREEDFMIKTTAAIASARALLAATGARVVETRMEPLFPPGDPRYEPVAEHGRLVEPTGLPSMREWLGLNEWVVTKRYRRHTDHHPLPKTHLAYARDVVCPLLGITVPDRTVSMIEDWQEAVEAVETHEAAYRWGYAPQSFGRFDPPLGWRRGFT